MPERNLIFWATSAGALATILTVFEKARKWVVSVIMWFPRQGQAATDITLMQKQITRILAEVMPNGGGSLRDAVSRVDKRLERVDERTTLNEQMQRASLADASHGIFHSDSTGRCIWVNAAYCKIVERLPENILKDGWQSHIQWEDRKMVLEEWAKTVASVREFDMSYSLTNGIRVKVVAHPMIGAIGQLLGYQGTVRVVDPENK